MKNYKREILV